jgi:HlyD family secretion protein
MAAAEADAAQQQAAYELAAFDRDAHTPLAKTGAVSERQGKQSVSTAGQQAAAVAAAGRRVEASNGALTTARANLANPGIRGEQVLMVRRQIAQQQAEIASALANAKQARFQLSEAQANRSGLIVRAPFDGTVITRSAEPGEVVPAGTAVVSLLDLSKVYLRGFVPEGSIGKVKAGQLAHVYLHLVGAVGPGSRRFACSPKACPPANRVGNCGLTVTAALSHRVGHMRMAIRRNKSGMESASHSV